MKILLSAYACEPNHGSEEAVGWNWAINLGQINHEIWILTRPDGREPIEQLMTECGAKMSHLNFVYIPNHKGIIEKLLRYIKLDWQYLYLMWQLRALKIARELDREINFDIVHHVSWGSITAGSWLWLLGKPFVLGPVGGGQTAPSALKKYFGSRWREEALRSLLSKKSLARLNWVAYKTVSQAELVLATNHDTYQLAKQLKTSRVELFLDTGLSETFLPQESPKRSKSSELRLLWVGSPVPRKGLTLTLEALSQVNPAIPVKMKIVGISPDNSLVRDTISKFKLEEQIICLGRKPWSEVKNQYLANDIFFFTSLRDSFGSQFLEAMAYGLPIITLNHHGARDFIPQQAGIKVPVGDAQQTVHALAHAIEYMYEHPQKRIKMGQAGYEFAQTQTWSCRAAKMTKYYDELLKTANHKRVFNKSLA